MSPPSRPLSLFIAPFLLVLAVPVSTEAAQGEEAGTVEEQVEDRSQDRRLDEREGGEREESTQEPIVFGFDFVPMIGTSAGAPDRPRILSLNLIGGMSGGTRFLEIGGVFNLNSGDVRGIQIAGALNAIRGAVYGTQIAGAVNSNSGHMRGAQVAGAANVNGGPGAGAGLQIAGGVNLNGGDFNGIKIAGGANLNGGHSVGVRIAGGANLNQGTFSGTQVAGGVNASGGKVSGTRIAGGVNVSGGDSQGFQVAGGANINRGEFSGFQVAGGVNVNDGDLQGGQVAPINYTRGHAGGVQVGVINISESANLSIAPIGIYLGGFVQPEVYGSDEGLLMAGVRHGRRSFYHHYSAGTRLVRTGGDGPTLAVGLGFGWRVELGDRVELTADLSGTLGVAETSRWNWDSRFGIHKFRPMIAVSLLDYLTIFGGPTLSLSVRASASTADPAEDGLIDPWELSDTVSLWPGFTVGVRFL